jgi:hypothetical protein
MGNVTVDHKHIPIVLRHSDRIRAQKLAKKLKAQLLSGEFTLSEPVDTITYG